MTTEQQHPKLVVLDSGERLECPEERPDGVVTDADIIPWDQVDGFLVWHEPSSRYLSIPVDHH